MSKSSRTGTAGKSKPRKKGAAGPIAFFVSLFIVALGTIQLVSTFHTYALNLSELNGLKREEASLVAKKQELENDIERWNDKAYVTAQARERLGFVFPGEQAVRVEHPEAVTGTESKSDASGASGASDKKVLPWYSELSYAFKQADKPVSTIKSDKPGDSDSTGAQDANGQSGQNADQSANSGADQGLNPGADQDAGSHAGANNGEETQ
jgi:cell division protein FtsB